MEKKNREIILYLPLYTNFYLYIEIKLDKNEKRKQRYYQVDFYSVK